MLNVKAALEDRFPDFFEKHTKIGPILLKFLGFLFHEARIQQFERENPYARGLEFVEKALLFLIFHSEHAIGSELEYRQKAP
jgi:hypothetical protein